MLKYENEQGIREEGERTMAIPKIPQLPIDIGALMDAGNIFSKQSERELYVTVLMDTSIQPELAAYVKRALYPNTDTAHLHIEPFFDAAPRIDTLSDICLIFAAKSGVVGELVNQSEKRSLPTAVVTLSVDEVAAIAIEAGFPLQEDMLIAPVSHATENADDLDSLFKQLGKWITDHCPETRLAFAKAFSFMRIPLARELSRATAFQNGAIGAAVFIPGADLPLMTLNQAKMLLQIAAAFGFSLGRERLKELAVVLLSALGFRAVSRKLAGYIPLLGWAIKGGIGYSSTLALGYAATEYFASGGEPAGFSDYLRAQIRAQVNKKRSERKARAESPVAPKINILGPGGTGQSGEES